MTSNFILGRLIRKCLDTSDLKKLKHSTGMASYVEMTKQRSDVIYESSQKLLWIAYS